MPCIWSSECDTVIAKDEMEYRYTFSLANSTRQKMAYRHMFIVTNSGYCQKGVRQRLSGCIEKGIRALFLDAEHMDFMEE